MCRNTLARLRNNTRRREAILIPRQVDWVDKYFQIGSVYYFTQSDSEKQIGYRGGILFVPPYFVWVLEI